jgi:hypothetical protein
MNNNIIYINNFKSLITLFPIPLILLGYIYIFYGEVFDNAIIEHFNKLKLYQLQTQLSIFNNEVLHVPLKNIPKTTELIGYYSVIFIYIIFSAWLVLFSISTYLKLSQKVGFKFMILLELSLILSIYIFSISPGLNLWLFLIGYLIILAVLIILTLYWGCEIKLNQ